ncbi:hypothetical protein KIN20_009939, partial [Parelaphostrongylus tenuis]
MARSASFTAQRYGRRLGQGRLALRLPRPPGITALRDSIAAATVDRVPFCHIILCYNASIYQQLAVNGLAQLIIKYPISLSMPWFNGDTYYLGQAVD